MNGHSNSPYLFSLEELTAELKARENQWFTDSNIKWKNPALQDFTTKEIRLKCNQLKEKSRKCTRGNWYYEKRLEPFEANNKYVSWNVHTVCAVCFKRNLRNIGKGFLELNVRPYEEIYRLSPYERFYGQPASAGVMWTGVLVAPNIVATSAHMIHKNNVQATCFFFNFYNTPKGFAKTTFLKQNVYYGVKILHQAFNITGINPSYSDWVLVQLDRNVEGQRNAIPSDQSVYPGQDIYILGHPCGLPMKYSPSGKIKKIEKVYFTSEIDLYEGNSGSPVFDANNHKMIGIVSASDPVDFDWDEQSHGFRSVIYPHKEYKSHGGRIVKSDSKIIEIYKTYLIKQYAG